MFDNFKKSLGISKVQTTGKGHVLGRKDDPPNVTVIEKSNNNNEFNSKPEDVISYGSGDELYTFDLTFTDAKLGMSVEEYVIAAENGAPSKSRPIVTKVTPNLQAQRLGVQVGDSVIGLEGNDLTHFDDFFNFIEAIGRPITISFLRRKAAPPLTASATLNTAYKSMMASMPTISMPKYSTMGTSDSSPRSGGGGAGSVDTSEEERAARREVLSRAAADRTQAWDRKMTTNKNSRDKRKDESTLGAEQRRVEQDREDAARAAHPETQRVIQKTKELELNIEKSMGYSPFRPHMSFSSGAAAAVGVTAGSSSSSGRHLYPPAPPPSSGSAAPSLPLPPSSSSSTTFDSNSHNNSSGAALSQEEEWAELDFQAELTGAVDDALAMLLSLGEEQQEAARAAVHTVYKMLLNLSNNRGEIKLRSIRMSNKVFQNKVALVPGGIEMLVAAGYAITDKADTAGSPTPGDSSSPHPIDSSSGDRYLVHAMDRVGERQLDYTLARIKELIDSNSAGGIII